ncbi:hypothetical protein BKA61DRAFT_481392 [Leptodontidium sp. MPI-SDFR-AT-0119]|nr:hypothetical protein BKA61DRAFT_481392 [Leptodontidium sp. MPI-SDFR-AT-0119]
MLKNFGELFPECSPTLSEITLYSSRLNVFSLSRQSNVQIKWVDVLSAHLEFDSATKTLLLFRLPSFCLFHSRRVDQVSAFHYILKAFNSSTIPGNPTTSITQAYLNEVILSYRLLFGQDRRSRHSFMSNEAARTGKHGIHDPLLRLLCGKKKVDSSSMNADFTLTTRGFYGVKEDFPLLGQRLVRLQEFNMVQDSNTLREFWADRRNPFNFYTFWAVIVVGGVSILLSFTQCGLSIAQLVVSIEQAGN